MNKEEEIQYWYNLQSEAIIYRDISKWINNGKDPFFYQYDVDKFTYKLNNAKK